MTDTFSPPVWRRRIATEMKRLRRSSGLSQAEVAAYLSCRVPKISLIESGQRYVQEDDLDKLLELYQVADTDRDYYVTANKLGRLKGWWEGLDEHVVPDWAKHFIGLEQGAHSLRSYNPTLIPSLLQIPEYTTAMLANAPASLMGDELIRRKVNVRQRRTHAITREEDPLQLTQLVDESSLHRVIGGPQVMQRQLEHVAKEARERPNVTVRIVPYESGAAFHDFSIFSFSWSDDPGVVAVEHTRTDFLESLGEIDAVARVFKRFSAMALSSEESLEFIEQTANKYATAGDIDR